MRQLEQPVEDEEEEYAPDKQLTQTVEEATEYNPAAQIPVTALRPVDAQNDPAVQAVHTDEPVSG